MLLYILGYITGLVSFLITIYAFFWLILKLFKKVKDTINPNPTKEILKEYLFIWDFVEDITTVDELKEKLKTIPSKKLYKNNSNKIYFTKEEALAFKDSVDEISVSLNAENAKEYDRLSQPDFDGAFDEVKKFIKSFRKR